MKIVFRILFYPIVLLIIALCITELIPIAIGIWNDLPAYQWMFYGMAAYMIIRLLPFVRKNETWMQTFSHELTHTIVGFMFFQKIHSFHVEEGTGEISRSGKRFGDIFIGLAPYCLPIFTYAFLLLRIIGSDNMLYIFDLFIGFSYAFHLICYWKQTGLYQTDLQKQGYVRSFLFIIAARLFNAIIILLSIRAGIVDAVVYLFPAFWNNIISWWNYAAGWITALFSK